MADIQAETLPLNQRLEWDKSVIGVEVDAGTFTVTREMIQTFIAATGDTNPLFSDEEVARAEGYRGIIAPPTFYSTFRTASGLDPKVVYGDTGFHAGQEFEFLEPICIGDVINAKAKIKDVYAKTGRTGTMVFTVRETAYYNQEGRMVGRTESSMVRRFVQRGD